MQQNFLINKIYENFKKEVKKEFLSPKCSPNERKFTKAIVN